MDFYQTRYSDLSNEEVNELYRSDTWSDMSRDERVDALQELENRSAEACGNQPCQVRTEEMNGYQFGGYANGEIVLNEHLVADGEFVTQYSDGSVETVEVGGINAQMMDTIHHENYHAYQDEVVHGQLEHSDAAEAELWSANWPDEQYISGDDPSGCYRIQSLEQSAFNHGEAETKAAFGKIEAKYGEDAGYQEYQEAIAADSYESALEDAKMINGDENIQETLNNNMLESYHANQVATETLVAEQPTVETASTDDTASSTGESSVSDDLEDCL